MNLVEPMRKVRPEPIPLPPYFEPEDFLSEHETSNDSNAAATPAACEVTKEEPSSKGLLSAQDVTPLDAGGIAEAPILDEPSPLRPDAGDPGPDPTPSGENDAVL